MKLPLASVARMKRIGIRGSSNRNNPDCAAGRLRPGYVTIEAGSLATRQRQPLRERAFVQQ